MNKKLEAIMAEVYKEKPVFRHYLESCDAALHNDVLYLKFEEDYTKALVGKSENRKLISDAAKNIIGRDIRVIIPDFEECDWDDSMSGLLYNEADRILKSGVSIGNKFSDLIAKEVADECSTETERKVVLLAIKAVVDSLVRECTERHKEEKADDREPDF